MSIEWISIKDRLPEHEQHVLSINNRKVCCVVIFIDNKRMSIKLEARGIKIPEGQKTGSAFCSQEIKGNVLNNVTHWMPLPIPPEEK